MNILVYSNVLSYEMHASQTVEIIRKHLDKKDNVFLLTSYSKFLKCLPHSRYACKNCREQQNYVVKDIFENQIEGIEIDIDSFKDNFNCPEFKNVDEILNYRFDSMPLGELSISQITDNYRQVVHKVEFLNQEIKPLIRYGLSLYQQTKKIIDIKKIDTVYAWNGRRVAEGPVLYAAKEKNINFYSYISGGNMDTFVIQPTSSSHDLSYAKDRMNRFYKEIFLNEDKRDYYITESKTFFDYMRYGGGKVWGYVYYNELFDNSIKIKKKNDKKLVTIFTSSYYEFYALGKDFRFKNGKDINHYKNLTKIINSPIINEKYDIRVRWHPNLSTAGSQEAEMINKIIAESSVKTIHYAPLNKINSYELLELSDVVISFGSTIGAEATYYGKPSILWGVAYYEDTDAVYNVGSIIELENLLNNELKAKPKENAMKFAFHERCRGEFKYKFIKYDKNHKYFYNNKRIFKPTFFELVKENIKIILKPFGLIKFGRKILSYCKKLIGVKKNDSYTPSQW